MPLHQRMALPGHQTALQFVSYSDIQFCLVLRAEIVLCLAADVPDLEHSRAPEGWTDEYESSHGSDSESEHDHSDVERIPTPSLPREFHQTSVDVVRADSSDGPIKAETVNRLPLASLKLADKPKKHESQFRRIFGMAKRQKKTTQNATSTAHLPSATKPVKT